MSIQRDDIIKVAHLAHIQVSEEQIPDITNSINDILQLIDAIQQVDTRNVTPLSNPHDARQQLREDIVTSRNQRDAMLANAPLTENGLFLVPVVIE